MLVRLLISAMLSGAVAVAAAVALGVSFWALPFIYSFAGTTVLLGGGLFGALFSPAKSRESGYGGAQLKSASVRLRH